MTDEVILAVAMILAIGVGAQWLGWRVKIPSIVFLLAAGLFVGPVTGLIEPDAILGDLLFPIVSMAVAVILFEGALSLGGQGIRDAGSTVWRLLTIGAATTLVATAFTAHTVFDIDYPLAWLLAGVLVVTGPTVIGPLVRSIGLRGRTAKVLELEGTLIDPMGAIITVLFFEGFFEAEVTQPWPVEVLMTLGVGAVAGVAGALLIVFAFGRYLIPDELHNVMTLATVLVVFAVADEFQPEAGLVAVTAMGMALGSQNLVSVDHVLEFNETLRTLFIAGLFVLLGARIAPETLYSLGWQNLLFLVILVVAVRPLSVYLSTIRSPLSWQERLFVACTAPRGIVAAAVASIFSLRLTNSNVDGSQVVIAASFTVIAGTVLLCGLIARPLGLRLGLIDDSRFRTIVLGSNRLARGLAHTLAELGGEVTLVGMDRRYLADSQLDGLTTVYGSVINEETWEALATESAGLFLAMSSQDEVNALAARHAAQAIGRRKVFQIVPRRRRSRRGLGAPTAAYGRALFAHDADIDKIDDRMDARWALATTKLTAEFRAKDYFREHPAAMVLGAKRGDDVMFHDAGQRIVLRAGDTVISLLPPSDTEGRLAQRANRNHGSGPGAPSNSQDDPEEPASDFADGADVDSRRRGSEPPRDPDRLAGT